VKVRALFTPRQFAELIDSHGKRLPHSARDLDARCSGDRRGRSMQVSAEAGKVLSGVLPWRKRCHPSIRYRINQPMATLRTPREAWVQAGLQALANQGPDAVRVEVLAQSLGVTKGGFYGQFTGRRELLDQMLETWSAAVVDQVIDEVERDGGDARARLERLFTIAKAGGEELVKIELAVRDWARRDAAAAEQLRRVDERRMQYMRSLFGEFCADEGEVEARCLLVFSLFIGSSFVATGHGGRTRKEVLDLALRQLVA
jgi:AcrR family transcriptional regulator